MTDLKPETRCAPSCHHCARAERELRRRWAPSYSIRFAAARIIVLAVMPWAKPVVCWIAKKRARAAVTAATGDQE